MFDAKQTQAASSLPLSLWGAIDIAENRTFSYQQIHAKKHRY